MYYLGVDGGGTKTKYILADEDGKIVYEIERETSHINQIGAKKLFNQLKEVREFILNENNIKITDIKAAFFGMPGYGEVKSDKIVIDEIIEKLFGTIKYKIGNDSEVGWAAGTECKPGINIVAGTGSIAYGKNREGKEGRCGGWGPGIGDDASAYNIGIKVINEYTKQKDGRSDKTVLVDIIENDLEIKDYFEIVDIVFNKLNFGRTEIAKFAKYASLAAEKNCEASKRIFNEAAIELAKHIKSLSAQLELDDEFVVSYTGGVFNAGDFIIEPFKKAVKNMGVNCNVKAPKLEPWEGAVLLARTI
ncbi:MAG: BadF/BadG/BcrA/BcrD ATPase family protein [Sarcina sp.]